MVVECTSLVGNKKGKIKMAKYQVTLYCSTEQYRPISTFVTIPQEYEEENLLLNEKKKQEIITKGITKICQKKYWTKRELQQYHYTRVKARQYKENNK